MATRVSEHEVQQAIGGLLRLGVIVAAAVTALGGALLLIQHGGDPVAHRTFRGEPPALESIVSIVRGALTFNGEAIAQLGLLLLIATPVARVAFTLVAFALQRDRKYVVITSIVLSLLVYALAFGKA
ncbi:MAG TPA: DUF1634 domain-containing protein [Gemmatimonadaceae bacterium]|jgi:uncharacterized membrane protein|nr:DUF1634 domain-containing protein [Gemmatimonadaceae bacterium]